MNANDLVKTIKHLEISTNRKVNEVFAGNYKSSFRGQGLEVSDIREYEDGDDARYIDWIITARQGKPYVKKFQETRELTTVLMVDISSSMRFTTAEKQKSRISLEVSSYILFSALKNNDKFGVIIFADKIYSYIPPKKGRKHLLYILREMIQYFDEDNIGEANLSLALDYLNKIVKKRSICFLLTDNIVNLNDNEEKGLKSLKIASRKHDFIYVNIYDDFERAIKTEYPSLRVVNPESNEEEIINLSNKNLVNNYNKIRIEERKKELDILKKIRMDNLSVSTTSNIYKSLLLFFRKRALKF